MKRIEFIAPVEAMRGNLSGAQTLVYAENDNPAFEAPVGRQYARNYQPRFIGAKRASDGHKYFSVKRRSATLVTPASKIRMALLGAAGAIYAMLIADKESAKYAQLEAAYLYNKNHGLKVSLREWAMSVIRSFVSAKQQGISFIIPGVSTLTFKNPWYDGTQTEGYEISSDVIVKFWMQLAPNAIKFTVDGLKGISQTGWEFHELIAKTSINVLNLSTDESGASDFPVVMGERYLKLGDNYVVDTDVITATAYITTDVAPA